MIKEKDIILINYVAYDQSGNVFDTTSRELAKHLKIFNNKKLYEPAAMIVGEFQIVKGLDKDVIGKELGYEGSVVIPPKWAFGEYDEKLNEVLPIQIFSKKPKIDEVVMIEGRMGFVRGVLGNRVKVDFNHYLADQTLKYDYQIVHVAQDENQKLALVCKSILEFNISTKIENNTAIIDAPIGVIKDINIWNGVKQVIMRHIFNVAKVDFVYFLEKYRRPLE